MAVTYSKYGRAGNKFSGANINYLSNTIKVTLHANTYTPNLDTHEFFSDVSASELSTANGYTAGGATLGSKTATYDSSLDQTVHDAADVSWTPGAGQTLTARYAIVWKDTGTASTSPLIALVDFGADTSAFGAALTISWSSTGGVFRL